MYILFPLRRALYPMAVLGGVATLATAGMLTWGLGNAQGTWVKLAAYMAGLALACGLWLYTDRYVATSRAQQILRLAAAIDGGLGLQMNLSYIFWRLDLPSGSASLYHAITAEFLWLGPSVMLCGAFFYLAFKASFQSEPHLM